MQLPATEFTGLRRVVRRLLAEDGFPSIQFAIQSVADYEKFFMLTASRPNELLRPSVAVDLVWQRHMLDTKTYMDDCRRWAGGYIHRESGMNISGFDRCADELRWDTEGWGCRPAEVYSLGGNSAEYQWKSGSKPNISLGNEDYSLLLSKTRQALLTRDQSAEWVKDAQRLLEAKPEIAIEEYRRFLSLMLHCTEILTPAKLVDEIWHQHILDSRNYFDFCNEIAGRYLHHTPSYEEKHEFHRPKYLQTRAIYSKHFEREPIPEIWSHMGESGGCSSEQASPYHIDTANEVEIYLVPGTKLPDHQHQLMTEVHPLLAAKGLAIADWARFLIEVQSIPILPPPPWAEWVRSSRFRWRFAFVIFYPVAIALSVALIHLLFPVYQGEDGRLYQDTGVFYVFLFLFIVFGFIFWIIGLISCVPFIYRYVTPKIPSESAITELISKFSEQFGPMGIEIKWNSADIIVRGALKTETSKHKS